MTATFHPGHTTAFTDAEAYLAGGRRKTERPVCNNTKLVRVHPDMIALVFHQTPIVTYHRDGTFSITGGGWNTVTTKQRIGAYSPARPGSDGNDGWIVGWTEMRTPARVQKCRMCSKTGPRWTENIRCDEASRYCYDPDLNRSVPNPLMCEGGKVEYGVSHVGGIDPTSLQYVSNWDQHYESRYDQPCLHGEMKRHQSEPCSHGAYGAHVTGTRERECWQCKGIGTHDYGSKLVPIVVNADGVWRVDANGKVIDDGERAPGYFNATTRESAWYGRR